MIQSLRVFDDALTKEEELEMFGEAQWLAENPHHVVHAQGRAWPGMLATEWTPPLVRGRRVTASGFRIYLPEDIERQPTFIHHDQAMGENTCITLVQSSAATAVGFFRHNGLGWDRIPEEKPGWWSDQLAQRLEDEGQADRCGKRFELVSVVELKPRRHVIFDASLFHARWPYRPAAPRLVHVCWFDNP